MQVRLDKALTERGLVNSRSRAQYIIKSGVVLINGKIVKRASYPLRSDDEIKIERDVNPWVSRSGLKLQYAIKTFNLAPLSGIGMDIGASTGGFTEVILAYGCEKVYAIDVGKGQLSPKLREDSRVVSLEGVNAKKLLERNLPRVDLIVCDASFISFSKVIKVPLLFANEKCQLIALIKPQFEVGPHKVGKKGIVKDRLTQKKVCNRAKSFLEEEGWLTTNMAKSPLLGDGGNLEFLLLARKKNTK